MIYNRTTWENSPSTSTPINAQNLNKIEQGITDAANEINAISHIVNVGTEAEEDCRVNFIHSRNIIDSSNFQSGAYSASNGQIVEYGTRVCTINKIPVEPSTKYAITINTTTSYSFLMIVDAYSEDGTYLGRISANNGNSSGYVETQATAKYINITMRDATDSQVLSSSFLQYLSNGSLQIQLVKGETSLDYEPFIPNQIVVDNETFTDTIKVSNEVDGRSRVNVLKSNNSFSSSLELGTIDNTTGNNSSSNDCIRSKDYIRVEPNTKYTIKNDKSYHIYVYEYAANYGFIQYTGANTSEYATQRTLTTTSTTRYIRIRTVASSTENDLTSKWQLNKGSSALTYEPYIVPSINVDGEMLVSKNTYSTSEVVIGEWLGKPLYRKVIEITNPTLDAWTNVNHNISNMDFGRIVEATLTRTIYGTTSYIPIGVSNISAGTLFTCDLQKTIIEYKIAGYTNITKLTAVLEYTKTTDA